MYGKKMFVLFAGRILIVRGVILIVQLVWQNSPTVGIPAILCSKAHSNRSTFIFFNANF